MIRRAGKMFKKLKELLVLLFVGKLKYARFLGVTIGENCRIYTTDWGSEPFLITIGDNVTVTYGVKFITHDGSLWLMRDEKGRRYFYSPISIGSNVFIGIDSLIMPGVKIEDRVIVAAGSVVTKSVPAGSVVAGVPAKIIESFDNIEKRALDNYICDNMLNNKVNYKQKILKITSQDHKPFLDKEQKA